MRYAGGYDSDSPWDDVNNPLQLRRSEPWRIRPNRNFSGGSLEGLVAGTSQLSDYLYDAGFEYETAVLQQRGYLDGKTQMRPWNDMYPTSSSAPMSPEEEPDYFEVYGEEETYE
jgi:hypothetical protein